MFVSAADSSVSRLGSVLLKTFCAIALGFACVRYKYIDVAKGELKSLGFYVGKVAFPLLLFKTIAEAKFVGVNWGVIVACNVAKAFAYVIAFVATWVCDPDTEKRLAAATINGFFSVASNDFAIGFPIMQALYPPNRADPHAMDVSVYVALNALVVTVLFIPASLLLLSFSGKSRSGCEILWDIISNPMLMMTALGLAFQFLFPHGDNGPELPQPLAPVVELITSPFSMLALFLTGASLRTAKPSRWPYILVLLKVVFCAFVGVIVMEWFYDGHDHKDAAMEKEHSDFLNFCFLYGSIPTSSAPLVLATEYARESVQVIATSIILGLLVSGLTMFSSSMVFQQKHSEYVQTLAEIINYTTYISIPCVLALLLLALAARRWMLLPPMDLVVAHTVAIGMYVFVKHYIVSYVCINPKENPVLTNWDSLDPGVLTVFLPDWHTILFGFCQNFCRGTTLLLVVYKMRSFPTSGTRCSVLLVACVALAIASVTPPNTFNEICGLTVSRNSIARTTVVVAVFFFAFVLKKIWQKRGLPRAADLRRVSSQDSSHGLGSDTSVTDMDSSGVSAILLRTIGEDGAEDVPMSSSRRRRVSMAQGFLWSGLSKPDKPHVFEGLVFAVSLFQMVILAMELFIGCTILFHGVSDVHTASFTQMMIIEYLLEHSQALFVLALVLFSDDFKAVIERILYRHRHIASVRPDTRAVFDAIVGRAEPRERRWLCRRYRACVSGQELVELVLQSSRDQSLRLGATESSEVRLEARDACWDLLVSGLIAQVDGKVSFYDDDLSWYYLQSERERIVCPKQTASMMATSY